MITEKTKKKMSLARKRYWKKRKAAIAAFKAKKPFDDYSGALSTDRISQDVSAILCGRAPRGVYSATEISKNKSIFETFMDCIKGLFS